MAGYGIIVGDYFYIANGGGNSSTRRVIRKIHITNKTKTVIELLTPTTFLWTVSHHPFIEHYDGYLYVFKGGSIGYTNYYTTIERVNLTDDSVDSDWHHIGNGSVPHDDIITINQVDLQQKVIYIGLEEEEE